MKSHNTFFGLIVFFLILLGIISVCMLITSQQLETCENLRHESFVIADELKQSSDDLTRYCRTYVSTGDSIWESLYWDILDIRNGLKPRPDGNTISLRDSMIKLGFSEVELKKLEEAEKKSNELVCTEKVAFNAMKGIYADSVNKFTIFALPDTNFARKIMFDEKYHASKRSIMDPIEDFFVLLNNRTKEKVNYHQKIYSWLTIFAIGIILIILIISLYAIYVYRKKILSQIEKLTLFNSKLQDSENRFRTIFMEHKSVMLLVNPKNGKIEEANRAAIDFYGYTHDIMVNMKISQINTLPEKTIKAKMTNGLKNKQNFFEFQHILFNGEIRDVEVYSTPVIINEQPRLFSVIHDVTAKRKFEIALKESEEKYRLLTDMSGDMIVMHRNFEKYYVNPAVEKILGFTAEEYLKVGTMEGIHPDDMLTIEEQMNSNKYKKGENSILTEFRKKHKDGHYVWISSNAIFEKISDDNFITIVNQRDITNQKIIENQNKELTKLQQHLLDNISAGIMIIDKETHRIEHINNTVTELYGDTPNNILGKICHFMLCPEEIGCCPISDLNKTIDNSERILLKKNKTKIPILKTVKQIKINNQDKIIETFIDISELKKTQRALLHSEKYLQEAQKTAHIGHWNWDIQNEKLSWSDEIFNIFGVSKETFEVSAENFEKTIHPDDLNDFLKEREKSLKTENGININHRIIRPSGEIRHVQETAKIIRDEQNITTSVFGTVLDITELKQIETKLKELNATKDKFFSIIAHDLKNPFNSILGFSELLLKNLHKYEMSKIEYQLQIIRKSVLKAYDLLLNLLEWSRMQQGEIKFSPINNSIRDLLIENISYCDSIARKKNIDIILRNGNSYQVYCDRNMIDTVLRNLITNAIKFTKEKGKVIISYQIEGKYLIVKIVDTGIGIDEKIKNSLFKIGETSSKEGTKGEEGTGLGLILCKEFIDKNGGNIWVESELGKGASFYFSLPLCNKTENLNSQSYI